MPQAEVQGLKMNLEKIGQMTQEDIYKLQVQNKELQSQINLKKQDIEAGNFIGNTKREKGKSYQKLIEEIDKLTEQIEINQQIIEAYVQARVERGDFKSWGIKDMNDFIKASKKSYDLSIEEEKKGIKKAENQKETLEEAYKLHEINLLIEEKNKLLDVIQKNVEKIDDIKRKITDNENKITFLIDKLSKVKENERDSIREEIEQLKVDNINLQTDKKTITDENRLYILTVQEIDNELKNNGVENTDKKSLDEVYNENKLKVEQKINSVKEFLDNNNIVYSSVSIESLDNEIKLRKENIADLMDRKEKMDKANDKIKNQQADVRENSNAQTRNNNQNTNTQHQINNIPANNSNGNILPSYSYGNTNLPTVRNNESFLKKAQKRINNLIDRFNPKLRQQRIEFVKNLHPDWDDKTVASIANNKNKAKELNDLIKRGVKPEVYAKSEKNKDIIIEPKKNENVISSAAKSFDELIKLESVVNNPQNNYSDKIKETYTKIKESIIKSVESKDDR